MNGFGFISAVLGFASGIMCRSLLTYGWSAIAFVGLLAAIVACAHVVARKRSSYVLAALFLIAAAVGSARVQVVPQVPPADLVEQIGETIELTGTVIADPDVRETGQRVSVHVAGTTVLAVAPLYPEVRYGTEVRVTGMLTKPEPFSTDGGRMFRYDQFLAKDGIFLLVENASIETVGERRGVLRIMFGALIDAKHMFMDALSHALPEPHASLASGLLLGGKQGLGSELLDAFTIAGLVHIVVLSGYNIMIIADAVLRLGSRLPRRIAYLLSGVVIGGFVLAAGAGAAAVRAGLMAAVALFARISGRTYDAMRALMVAMVAMLLWNPLLLAYDPGFQLSVLATLGLILGASLIERHLAWVRVPLFREILATTLAAQIAVLPLLLYQTGNLSLVSLIANMVVLPVIPVAMAMSFAAGVIGVLAPPLAPVAGLPAYVLLTYVVEATSLMASLPLAQLVVPAFPFALVGALYGALAIAVAKYR